MTWYCPKCGRMLQDDEVCTCEQDAAYSEQADSNWDRPSQERSRSYSTQNASNWDRQSRGRSRSNFAGSAAQTAGKVFDGTKKAFNNVRDQMPKDSKEAGQFFQKLKNRLGFGTPESNSLGVYERNRRIVPDCIETNENEVPIKQYNIAVLRSRMKFMRAEGRLQVTNKRVIFRATGRSLVGKTVQQQEFELDHLKGIEVRRDFRFSILNYLLAALIAGPMVYLAVRIMYGLADKKFLMGLVAFVLGGGAMIPFFILHKKFWLKLMASVFSVSMLATYYNICKMLGQYNRYYDGGRGGAGFFGSIGLILAIIAGILTIICWFMVVWVPNLVIAIKTDGSGHGSGAVLIRRKPTFLEYFFHRANGSEEYSGFAEVLPWIDTEVATDELGALIDDLQKLGDYGIEKWKIPD